MAASVEIGADGAGGAPSGGLDELIRALARYSSGLERVAAAIGGASPSQVTPAPQAEFPPERSAPPRESSQAFRAIAEWFSRNAPRATRVAKALSVQPGQGMRRPAPPRAPQPPPAPLAVTKRTEANKNTDVLPSIGDRLAGFASTIASRLGMRAATSPAAPTPEQLPTPASSQSSAIPPPSEASSMLADLMRQLVEIAQGISRKIGVEFTAGSSPPAQPAPAPASPPEAAPAVAPKGASLKAKKPAAGGGMMGAAGGAIGGALGGLAAGLGAAIAAPIAFAEVVSGVASQIAGFISAINPGLVQTLGFAFRDLTAVVGIALQPILQAAVPIIRQFTNALLPLAKTVGSTLSGIFEALQPAIDALTDTFFVMAAILDPIVQLVGDALEFLAPVFTLLANIVKQVYVALGSMVAAIVGVIRGLFGAVDGDGFKDVMQGLQDGLKMLTAALIRGLGYMLKFFGSIAGLNGMIDFLKKMNKPKENAQGIAAAQNAQFTSIEQVGKSAALASVIATAIPGGKKEEKTDQDFFQGMIEELEGIKDNGPSLIDAVNSVAPAVGDYLLKLPAQIGKSVADAISSTAETVGKAAYEANPLKSAGEALGDMAAWMIYGSPK